MNKRQRKKHIKRYFLGDLPTKPQSVWMLHNLRAKYNSLTMYFGEVEDYIIPKDLSDFLKSKINEKEVKRE